MIFLTYSIGSNPKNFMIWPFNKRKEEKRTLNPMVYKRSYIALPKIAGSITGNLHLTEQQTVMLKMLLSS